MMPVQDVAKKYKIGDSAIRRHTARHLSTSLLRETRATADLGSADLIAELADVLGDVRAVRSSALMGGQAGLVLRAAGAERELIELLLGKLDIDDLEVAGTIKACESLSRSVVRIVRGHPRVGDALATDLRAFGDEQMAAEVSRVADDARLQSKELVK
jgi:hypothetical protein